MGKSFDVALLLEKNEGRNQFSCSCVKVIFIDFNSPTFALLSLSSLFWNFHPYSPLSKKTTKIFTEKYKVHTILSLYKFLSIEVTW